MYHKRKLREVLLAAILATLFVQCAPATQHPPTLPALAGLADNRMVEFDGLWQGELEGFHAPGLFAERTWDLKLRLNVSGRTVAVSYFSDGEWRSAHQFQIDKHSTNAVVYGTHSSEGWVETWVFALTHKTPNSLLAYWYRVVNNYLLPPDAPKGRFAFAASGELHR